ncbi:MAG: hypothetical protein ACKVWV_14785 [Planctomycetota bacterium]
MTSKRVPVLRFVAWAATVHAVVFAAWITLRPETATKAPSTPPEFTDLVIPSRHGGSDEVASMPQRPPLATRDLRTCEELEERIEASIGSRSGKSGWAGKYVASGRNWGSALHVAPDLGFVAHHESGHMPNDSDTLDCTDLEWGRVEERDGALWLDPAMPCDIDILRHFSPLVPIAWGDRRYLVRAADLLEFVCSVESGAEPRGGTSGQYYLREGDERTIVEKPLEIPEAFRETWRASVHARVIHVLAVLDDPLQFYRKTTLELDVGTAHAVQIGDRFWLDAHSRPSLCARVTAVEERTCTALLRQTRDDVTAVVAGAEMSSLPNLRGRFSRADDADARERAVDLVHRERDR